MADAEPDFSSLPLPDRFAHKVCYLLLQRFEAACQTTNRADHDAI